MGIFNNKRNNSKQLPPMPSFDESDIPDLPEFPDMSEEENDSHYEPSILDIKDEISKEEDYPEVPKTQSSIKQNINFKREITDKPVFVKIEKYKEVLEYVDLLKSKISDAESILSSLEDIRSKEEEKINEWKQDLKSIKDKLMSIDDELFEV